MLRAFPEVGMKRLPIAALLACTLFTGLAAAAAPGWPQERSEFKPDPALRYGALPNGMRYVLRRNVTPASQVSLRLRFEVGAVNEQEDQRGLAHFLEHMAFRGSAGVRDGEVENTLERLGLRFGSDTNAYTAQTETVYQFDLARNDEESLRTGLMLLREICDRLTLDATTFETERGVVIAEARARDGAQLRRTEAQQEFLLRGQLAADRIPIGKLAVLQHAPVERLRQFYRDWYRPELATLLVVGDIDVDALEKRLAGAFAEWRNPQALPPAPVLGVPAARAASVGIFSESGAQPAALLAWARPIEPPARNRTDAVRELARLLGERILTSRLHSAAAAGNRDFVQGGAGSTRLARSAALELLSVGYSPGNWHAAVTAAEQLRRQLVEQGVQQGELDRELLTLRTDLESQRQAADTRRSPEIIGELLRNLEEDEVSTSAEQDLALYTELRPQLTVAAVNAALRTAYAGSGPLLFLSTPEPIAGGEPALLATLRAAEQAQLADSIASKAVTWPYTSFGRAGRVVATSHTADLDLTTVRYANGVKLNIKPTHFSAGQILVNVYVGNGLLDWPRDRPSLAWAAAAVPRGGLGKLSYDQLQRAMTGKVWGLGFSVGDSSYTFTGQTRPDDLLAQLQVMAAYLTDAGWSVEGFEQMQSTFLPQLATLRTNPSMVLGTQLNGIVHGGDQRWAFPTAAQVQATTVTELRSWLRPAFTRGDIEIAIVGDVSIEAAEAAVAETFGALRGQRMSPRKAADGEVRFPAATGELVKLAHSGGADQGVAVVAWPGTDALANLQWSGQRQLLLGILQDRLQNQLRERAGLSYSVSAQSQASTVFPGFGVLVAVADLPPAKAPALFDAVAHAAEELRAHAPNADELERARNPAIASLTQARQSNQYWISMLGQVQREPRLAEVVRQQLPNLRAVTAADLQAAANRYLLDEKAVRILVQPEGATAR
jgi:zinc protease